MLGRIAQANIFFYALYATFFSKTTSSVCSRRTTLVLSFSNLNLISNNTGAKLDTTISQQDICIRCVSMCALMLLCLACAASARTKLAACTRNKVCSRQGRDRRGFIVSFLPHSKRYFVTIYSRIAPFSSKFNASNIA